MRRLYESPCLPELASGRDLENRFLLSKARVMVQFVTDWCGSCHIIEPLVNELAYNYCGQLSVVRIDVGKHPEVGARYGVTDTPTFLFFNGGLVVDHAIGALPRTEMDAKMKDLADA